MKIYEAAGSKISHSAHAIDLTILRWLHTDWNTLENGVSVAFGFGVEVLELRASEGGGEL